MENLYVIDQNVLRRPDERLDRLLHYPSVGFVLPDTALVELVGPDDWENNLRQGFSKLFAVRNRCFMSCSVQEAIGVELKSGSTARAKLLPRRFTELLREMMMESEKGKLSQNTRARIEAVRLELKNEDLDADAAKADLQRYIDFLKAELSAKSMAACKDQISDVALGLLSPIELEWGITTRT